MSPRGLSTAGSIPGQRVLTGTFILAGRRDERALAAESVRCYSCQAKTVLKWLPEPLDEALAHLDPPTVTTFIVEQSAVADSVRSARAL